MELRNPFNLYTRLLYDGIWFCWLCGGNGVNKGGLELHHIVGRDSSSPFNSALLCGECHRGMNHSQEEEQHLFFLTLRFLYSKKYKPTPYDLEFLDKYKYRLFSEVVINYIDKI